MTEPSASGAVAAPRVAVIVATRDRPRLLADALESVALQDLAPLEVRIANDGEAPIEEAVAGAGLLEVTVIPLGAGHLAAARNRAAAGARAEVLAFLDDDDRWLPGHLAGLVRAFAEPETGLVYRDCAVLRERVDARSGTRIELERRTIARDWDEAVMRENDYLPPSAFAIRRVLFQRLGGFDESFAFSEDWDLLLRAAAHTRPRRVPGVSVEVRMRERGHMSAEPSPERQACLDRLAARHRLPRLAIKTFWEVAGGVGMSADRARSGR